MNLYLLRHGDANPSKGTEPDSARELSDRGRGDVEGAGRILSRLTPSITRILASPLVRAGQTAEIVQRALPGQPEVTLSQNLVPGFRKTSLLQELSGLTDQCVLAVGHQPDLTGLISYLISGASLNLEMEPGSLAALTITTMSEGPAGRLRWLLNPVLIRSLNGSH